jgi:ABC-2 type transport system permease protein
MSVNLLRSALFLLRLSLRRQLVSRQTVVSIALTLLVSLIVIAWSRQPSPTAKKLAEQVFVPTFVAFLMPVFSICYGASAIGGEREDKTLIYLLISSMPRWLVGLVKAIAAMSLAAGWTAATLALLCYLGGGPGAKLWPAFWPAAVLGAMAYSMLFLMLGTVFRHGTLIALAYWFFLEVIFGNIPGVMKRVSVAFYVRCMVYEWGANLKLGPLTRVARETFLAVSGPTAVWTLSLGTLTLLIATLIVFSRREYRELG